MNVMKLMRKARTNAQTTRFKTNAAKT